MPYAINKCVRFDHLIFLTGGELIEKICRDPINVHSMQSNHWKCCTLAHRHMIVIDLLEFYRISRPSTKVEIPRHECNYCVRLIRHCQSFGRGVILSVEYFFCLLFENDRARARGKQYFFSLFIAETQIRIVNKCDFEIYCVNAKRKERKEENIQSTGCK